MGNIFNPDFKDFISALNQFDVEYVLVGGYAVILYGYSRTTGDLDIWVKPTEINYKKLGRAFTSFGLPNDAIDVREFVDNTISDVFTFGRPPVSIDIMTQVKGLLFDATFNSSVIRDVEGVHVRLINYNTLIKAKKFLGDIRT